jgi:hypothetical protein
MTEVGAGNFERQGTVWVREDEPPATRPRWYVHWDGASATSFDMLEDAVSWGLERARTIIVRTVCDVVYWAGERPLDWDTDREPLRSWPPSTAERRQIDVDYEAAVNAANEEEAAREEYEREREEWLTVHAPAHVGHAPFFECLVVEDEDDELAIEFEELAPGAELCGARMQGGGPHCFGSERAVIAGARGLDVNDPWVTAVCAALAGQRKWLHRHWMLAVHSIEGEVFHVTASANRDSILRHGLDWSLMGDSHGIAGSTEPELPAVFVSESRAEAKDFFAGIMARTPVDVWAIRADGLWLESGPDGWLVIPEPVAPERLRLVDADLPPRSRH